MNDRLEDLVKRLPRRIEPERNLWPGIASQLRPRRRREPRVALYRLAATLAVLAIGLGTYFLVGPGTPPTETAGSIASKQTQPDPDVIITRNLKTVNGDIAKITAALQRDPDNPVLFHFLNEAYRHQNRLMIEQAKVSLSRSNMS